MPKASPGQDLGARGQFPVVENTLYFDSAHQTPLAAAVRGAIESYLEEASESAGPKSRWLERVEAVRARLAGFLGASADAIAFTKNTSEGLNIAAAALPWEPGDNVVLLEGEHPNNAYAWLRQRSRGLEVRMVPIGEESATADTFAPYVDRRTRAISLSHVTFHAGQRHDLQSIAKLTSAHGMPVVVDVMQSVGIVPLLLDELGSAIVVAGCHKGLLTPQGVGFLYRSPDLADLIPRYAALASVEEPPPGLYVDDRPVRLSTSARRFEIGNYNYLGISALDGALDLLTALGPGAIEEHLLTLGEHLLDAADELGVAVVGPRDRSQRTHINVLALDGSHWQPYLAARGVRCSAIRSGIRISFGLYNTIDEVDQLGQILADGVGVHGAV